MKESDESKAYNDTNTLKSRKSLYQNQSFPLAQGILDRLKITNDLSILDIGCGIGGDLAEMSKLNRSLNLVGIDTSEPQVLEARNLVKEATFISTAIQEFQPKQKFDRILARHVLHLIPTKELSIVIKKIVELLNENGTVLIVLHSQTSQPKFQIWNQWLKENHGSFHKLHSHRNIVHENFTQYIPKDTEFTQELVKNDFWIDHAELYLDSIDTIRYRYYPDPSDEVWNAFKAYIRNNIESEIETHGKFTDTSINSFVTIKK